MTALDLPGASYGAAPRSITFAGIQALCVWTMIASGWFVIVEPAPFDLLFVVTLILFLFSGLVVHAAVAPLIVFLVLYNLGAMISFLEVSQRRIRVALTRRDDSQAVLNHRDVVG